MSFMLDASAVLAVLLDEPGGDFVFDHIGDSQISTVNLSEVYATLLDGGMTYEDAHDIVGSLPFRIRTFDDDHGRQAAKLRPLTKTYGLSLGDRSCLAHAKLECLPVLTADRRMAEAQTALDLDIRMIR
jgi:ribonuclease VapC